MISEFHIIDTYLKKLANSSESLGLKDDCAIFSSNKQLIVNTDTIIENSHFFSQDAPESVATKMLEVNLSDISAMGATPKYWLMNLSINSKFAEHSWLSAFSNTLQKLQTEHGITLIGGDTTFSKTEMVISVTIIAEAEQTLMYKTTAGEADSIYVSNNIGDAYYGCNILEKFYESKSDPYSYLSTTDKNLLINKFLYPQAQLKLGKCISKYVSACTDVSDGLLIDLEKICSLSGVSGVINLQDAYNKIFSNPVKEIINNASKQKGNSLEHATINAITGGDDYELLFCVSKNNIKPLEIEVAKLGVKIHKIGETSSYNKNHLIVKDFSNCKVNINVPKGYIPKNFIK